MMNKGQSTVEYLLLVAAVVAVMIFVTTGRNSPFQQKLSNTVTMTAEGMQSMANRLTTNLVTP